MTPPHSKACDDVEKQKDDEVTTTSTTTKSTRTHQKGHDGVQCTDYNEHDTRDHTCHWCYEKVDSAEYLNGNWLTASFNVLIEKTKAGGKSGNLSPANQKCLLKDTGGLLRPPLPEVTHRRPVGAGGLLLLLSVSADARAFLVTSLHSKAEGGDGMFHIGLTTSAGRCVLAYCTALHCTIRVQRLHHGENACSLFVVYCLDPAAGPSREWSTVRL